MIQRSEARGWSWFEPAEISGDSDEQELCRSFARCLLGSDGQRVTEHLKRLILDRRVQPNVSDAELRHLEGQRFAVAYILSMVARGQE